MDQTDRALTDDELWQLVDDYLDGRVRLEDLLPCDLDSYTPLTREIQ
jgi:hypothetical protein